MKSKAAAESGGTAQVDAFMSKLKHPLKTEIETARRIILETSAAITEEIKWNAPGFRTTESFATVHLRSAGQLQLIFHLGAKVRPDLKAMKIADPAGLMKWLGKDRALVTVGTDPSAFRKIVRAWIKYV
jgi:hypothetical protein